MSALSRRAEPRGARRIRWLAVRAFVAFIPLSPFPAFAADGVLEINQSCAELTGCFSGDSMGFPVTIGSGAPARSFRLTSDLVVPLSTDGVDIATPSVTLDLNGFRIVRLGCETASTQCSAALGVGSGVDAHLTHETTVRNGSIVGMQGAGVYVGNGSHVSNLTIKWNADFGIRAGSNATVAHNRVVESGLLTRSGIAVLAGSIVTGNTVVGSAYYGILADHGGSIITSNSSIENGLDGIRVDNGASLVRGNTASQNTGDGISVAVAASLVHANTTSENGIHGITVSHGSSVFDNTSSDNSATGITATSGSMVHRNTVRGNTTLGLSFSGTASYFGNVVSDNTGGTVASGINMGLNSCNGTATCP